MQNYMLCSVIAYLLKNVEHGTEHDIARAYEL